jgi:endonuclease YncB( thermonuclease family)
MDELRELNYKDTPTFTFAGTIASAKVVKVYDGDTVTVAFKFVDKFWKVSVRMLGYDSPEIKSKDEVEKKCAACVRDYLADRVLGEIVEVEFGKNDKYGRPLATMIYKGTNINDLMLAHKWCRSYNGGKKEEWGFGIE